MYNICVYTYIDLLTVNPTPRTHTHTHTSLSNALTTPVTNQFDRQPYTFALRLRSWHRVRSRLKAHEGHGQAGDLAAAFFNWISNCARAHLTMFLFSGFCTGAGTACRQLGCGSDLMAAWLCPRLPATLDACLGLPHTDSLHIGLAFHSGIKRLREADSIDL